MRCCFFFVFFIPDPRDAHGVEAVYTYIPYKDSVCTDLPGAVLLHAESAMGAKGSKGDSTSMGKRWPIFIMALRRKTVRVTVR